jgi:Icc protein
MPASTVYFAHISDTHFGPTATFRRHGHEPLSCAERLVSLLNRLPQRPDFVIHTGDVVSNPDPAAYRLAAQTLARLDVPIYYVVGNHDRARDVRHFLPMGPCEALTSDPDLLSYAFSVRGYRFLVVDARGPDEIDPHGLFSEAQLDIVRAEIASGAEPLTIFGHFPVLPLNSLWMDRNMTVLNGLAFHKIMREGRDRLRGVFYGHVHQPMQTWRDGVLYVSVASAFSQFAAWPDDVDVRLDGDHDPGYGYVHLLPEQTIIHHHTFPRPQAGSALSRETGNGM